MDRKTSLLYAIAPLRFVVYAFVGMILGYFFSKWAFAVSAQVSIWVADGECLRDNCEFVADNRTLLYVGYAVIVAIPVAFTVFRYRAARRRTDHSVRRSWPWV